MAQCSKQKKDFLLELRRLQKVNAKLQKEKDDCVRNLFALSRNGNSHQQKTLGMRELREVFDAIRDGINVTDLKANTLEVNKAFCGLFGLDSKEEMAGRNASEFIVSKDLDKLEKHIQDTLAYGYQEPRKYTLLRSSGEQFHGETSTALVKDERGKPFAFVSMTRDVSDRLLAKESLQESEQNFRTLAEFTYDWEEWILPDGSYRYVSPSCKRITGYDSKCFKTDQEFLFKITHPGDLAEVRKHHSQHLSKEMSPSQFDFRIYHRDGNECWISHRCQSVFSKEGTWLGRRCSNRDITDRKRAEGEKFELERQFQQSQKMESLGVLAGGIAHDFNNLLLGILGYADLALMKQKENAAVFPFIAEIKKISLKLADLTKQMLAYSGKGKFVIEHVDLSKIVAEMGQLLNASISKKVEIAYDLDQYLPPILADTSQVRQLVMNLITNASESYGDQAGVVKLRTGKVDADHEYICDNYLRQEFPSGQYVFLEVNDAGSGMDKETKNRIFEPFFSTKLTGRGLGLAAALGIVKGHNGVIKLKSEPNQGTEFMFLFPCVHGVSAKNPDIKKQHIGWSCNGTVLLVDDERTVRCVAKTMLESIGLRVLLANDGIEALRVVHAQKDNLDLVILDFAMPRMDGMETFGEIRRLRSDLPVILSSGYNKQAATVNFTDKGLAGFIQKPYQVQELTQLVREVFSRRN